MVIYYCNFVLVKSFSSFPCIAIIVDLKGRIVCFGNTWLIITYSPGLHFSLDVNEIWNSM